MKKWFAAISFGLIVFMLLCSCGKSKNVEVEPVQESKTVGVPVDNDGDGEIESPADQPEDEPAQPAEDKAEDMGGAEDRSEQDTDDTEAAAQNQMENSPMTDAPEEAVPADNTMDENKTAGSDNNVAATVYDEYELPED